MTEISRGNETPARTERTSPGPYLTSCARTDVGMRRSSNEDAFVLVDLDAPANAIACEGERLEIAGKRMLLALSDGMGGAAAGEVASSLALSTLVRELHGCGSARMDHALEAAVHVANARVLEAASTTEQRGMGATLTAVVIVDNIAWIAEVGDSRAYLLRDRKLHQLTRDQSYVQMLVDIGAMSEEEAKESPRKNVILQAVGTAPELRVALGRLSLRRGDRLLLCSDGLSNELDDSELADLLTRNAPDVACEHAIASANQHGGRDNVTAIVAVLDGDALPLAAADEPLTATHIVLQEFSKAPG
jgi:serine/threonine protein phosphatase PrpC